MSTATNALSIRELNVPGYERVQLAEDPQSGLRAIIAVHNTTLGPALGGTRFFPYPDDKAALTDVKRLAEGMTYKAAAAGLNLGGGKAVIIGDPRRIKTAELLRSYGGFVETFDGTYITAADVGTNSHDLDVVKESTDNVVGHNSGSGDSGYSTALGVYVSMRAAARFLSHRSLNGVKVGIEGAGKVGYQLVGLLLQDGAQVIVAEPHAPTRDKLRAGYPHVPFVDDLFDADINVYAPCALGATLTHQSIAKLTAEIVCGAANNQLAADDVEEAMAGRHVTWVPDYVANAGGLIQVNVERSRGTIEEAHEDIMTLDESVTNVLVRAYNDSVTPGLAARRIVEDRLAVGRLPRTPRPS